MKKQRSKDQNKKANYSRFIVDVRKFTNFCLLPFALCLLIFIFPSLASAHPMGNFSISHYTKIKVEPDIIKVRYIIDMAEIPTFQEITEMDKDGDKTPSPEESQAYLAQKVEELKRGLTLKLNREVSDLIVESNEISFPPGAGNLPTLKIFADYLASVDKTRLLDRNSVFYQDNNFSGRAGWKEIIVLGSEGISIQSASVPSTDRSNELSDYPVDVLSSPPQEIEATFSFSKNQPSDILTTSGTLIMPQESGEYLQPSNANSRRFADAFTELISNKELSFEVILFALATAFGLGAFHALSPGHGKTVVAAYLVGSRGTASHALFLGMIVTLTHTIGVFILGLVTLYASKYIVPDKLYPWLGFFSGLTIVAIGTTLFVKRYRRLYGSHSHAHNNERAHVHAHAFAHSQGHDHGHSHTHGNEHAHAHALAHSHVPDHDHSRTHAWVHSHSHESDQGHSHSHDPDHAHSHEQSSRHSHFHDYFDHDHSDHGHHHTFDSGKEGVSLGSLFALGVSGGIVPCPSALVVLLSAISLHRIGFGLVLIVAFSLGLALVLTGIGLLMVYAKQFMDRFNGEGTVVQRLPLLSSIIITILGFGIAIQALVSGGIIQINLL